MTTDPNDTRPPHAPDFGFISRGSVFALCRCGALQIVDPAYTRLARSWLQERGWSRPPTNLASPDDGWFCPACTTRTDTTPLAAIVTEERHVELLEARLAEMEAEHDALAVKLGVAWADLQVMRAVDAEHLQRAVRAEAERDAARAGIGTMQEVVRNAAIDAMREYLPDFDGSRIDGGCTDGDEYDFTAAEVAQAVHAVGEALDEARAARDAARRDLARIVELCGWDCDGNDPESPSGAIHLYADAVQAVRELVEERAEDSREIVLLHRLCTEAADMLNEPTSTGGDAMDAMADRLRAAAGCGD